MSPWMIWVIIGIILLILEALTPEFIIGSFALGCFVTAIVSVFTGSLEIQLIVFAIVTAFTLWKIRPFFLNFLDSKEVTNVDLLKGRKGKVLKKVGPDHEKGRVLVGGEDWMAVSEDGTEIKTGEMIEVLRVDGSKLIIKSLK